VAPPLAAPDGVLPVWLALVPFEVTEPDACEVDVDVDLAGLVLAGVDGDVVAFGGCVGVVVGWGVGLGAQPVAVAVVLPVALVFAVAEAVAEAVALALLAVAVPVALAVAVAVPVGVLVAVVLSLGLALLLAGLALVLLLAELVAVLAGGTLGVADALALCEGDGVELGGHAFTVALAWLLAWLLELIPLADELIAWPDPAAP
jgi:hypothetical protein